MVDGGRPLSIGRMRGFRPGLAAALGLAVQVTAIQAQEAPASYRALEEKGFLRSAPEELSLAFRKNVTLLGIPPATVAPDGLFFAALSWTNRREGYFDDEQDGSAAVGFGLGVGDIVDLQFTAHITSLQDDFADSGYLDIMASRRLDALQVPTYVGLRGKYLAPWGDSTTSDPGISASLTSFPVISLGDELFPLMMTIGGGTKERDYDREPGFFAGVGIGLTETFGASVAFNGDNFDLGASFRLPQFENWGFTAVLSDAFDQDDQQRVILSINWIVDNVF